MTLLELGHKYEASKSDELLTIYDCLFQPIRESVQNLLEFGVYKGGSLRMWADYFSGATITGVDHMYPQDSHAPGGGCYIAIAFEQGTACRIRVCKQEYFVPEGAYDVIIDDCSHIAQVAEQTLLHCWPSLIPNGFYCIEDWGTAHNAGMVGLVKGLIDNVGVEDIEKGLGGKRKKITVRPASLQVWRGLAVFRKV